MAKKIAKRMDWPRAENVIDIYSVSHCVSHDFADYINFWKHNGYWFFDTPNIIGQLARENGIDLSGMKFFYYEVYERQYDTEKDSWTEFQPEASFLTDVRVPSEKQLEGYDVVSFRVQTSPECSPLSCNNLPRVLVNSHCLLRSLDEAKSHLESGRFNDTCGEPGPFRIFAVFSLPDISPEEPKP